MKCNMFFKPASAQGISAYRPEQKIIPVYFSLGKETPAG